MTHATWLWSLGRAPLQSFARAFTRPGSRRFAGWITALAINAEEHTITQSVTALERLADWKALETFAEYGAWRTGYVTDSLTRLIGKAPGRLWHNYHVSAVDDTKVHRSGGHVWGTCTVHEYTARCPDRAPTVRAHNRVLLGAPLHNPDQPAWSLPISGRLYFRKSQLPLRSATSRQAEPFRTKCELLVELLRGQARLINGLPLGVFDGGQALKSVARPLVVPEDGSPRIEPLTRLRHDARLHAPPPTERRPGQRGPLPKWGKRRPPPRQGGRRTRWWQEGPAFLYGRRRKALWKEILCLGRVWGHDVPAKAVVAKVEGSKERFTLVAPAVGLTGLQGVEWFRARFRQGDGFGGLKQRPGREECRAWTKDPIERTSRARWVTMSLLRLTQFRREAEGCVGWWAPPPWNQKEDRPSVLDVGRLSRRHRPEIQRLLSEWLGDEGEAA